MSHQKIRRVSLNIAAFCCFLLCGLDVNSTVFAQDQEREPQYSKEEKALIKKYGQGPGISEAPKGLKKIEFITSNHDLSAARKAQEVYAGYLQSLGVSTNEEGIKPDIAMYAPLLPGQFKRFLLIYNKNEVGHECSQTGCEIFIFENFEKNRWRKIFGAVAHEVYVDTKSRSNQLRDIYLVSYYVPPEMQFILNTFDTGEDGNLFNKWSWSNDEKEYVFSGSYIPPQ